MSEDSTLARIAACGVVPVITIRRTEDVDVIADALVAGDLPVAEITLRTPLGIDAIRRLRRRAPGVLVGAGTVTSRRQLEEALDAGAEFVVSPGIDPGIVECAISKGVLALPGTATPSEVQLASSLGLGVVKLFPAGLLGGPAMIDALSAPFPQLRFMPSGGVSPRNVAEYLARDAVVAVSGSWMLADVGIADRDHAALAAGVRAASNAARRPRA